MDGHRMTRVLLVVLAAGALFTALLAPASKVASQVSDSAPVASPDTATAAAVLAFWTPERMAAARPAPMPMVQRQARAAEPVTGPTGPAMVVAGNRPGELPGSGPVVGAVAAEVVPVVDYYTYPFPFTRTGVQPFQIYNGPALGTLGFWPWITNGKVFFQNAVYGPGTWVCSGTSTTSGAGGNRRLVWTAGHCVNSGGSGGTGGTWSTNVLFCPAYRDGNSPVGCWPSLQQWTLGGWFGFSNLRRDQGVIVTGLSAGWRLGDRVGTQGLAWNQARRQHWWAFGYPAVAPFNGARSILCTASLGRDDSPPGATSGPQTLGIGCDMTNGCSGGGWIWEARMGAGGFVNSVNSYKYTNPAQPLAMYGPYFDDGTLNLWNSSKNTFP